MRTKLLTGCLAAALALSALAEAPAPAKAIKLTLAERIAATRLIATVQPGKALKDWMSAGAFARWRNLYGAMIRTDDSSAMMTDFFAQAILITGTQNSQSGIWALYNPLQDNVLLIQTDNTERVPRIEDFAFLTGTAFRGEKLAKDERPQAIAPTRGDLDAVLLKNVAKTAAVFHKAFPAKAETVTLAQYRPSDDAADPVCANIAFRMAMLKRFTEPEAKADADKAGEIALLLWKGEAAALNAYFDSPADSDAAARYAALPAQVKSTMFPAVYYRTKAGSLLGFASAFKPDLLILVQLKTSGKPFFVFLPLNEKFATAMQSVEK